METYVQRQRKVRIEAHQQHKHGTDKVVNGSSALRWWQVGASDRDDGRKGTADVRAQHNSSGVLEREFGSHAVHTVLVDATSNYGYIMT